MIPEIIVDDGMLVLFYETGGGGEVTPSDHRNSIAACCSAVVDFTCGAFLRYDCMSLTEHNGYSTTCLYLPQYVARVLSTRVLSHKFSGFYTQYCRYFFNSPWIYVFYADGLFSHFGFQVYWRTPKARQYLQREVKRKKYYFDIHRPWTAQFQMDNQRGTMRKKVFVEPIREWSFFKGDRVRLTCIYRSPFNHHVLCTYMVSLYLPCGRHVLTYVDLRFSWQ